MKRPFVPDFLNNFDRKLLLNKPNTWSTRIHFVIYFSLLFMLLVAALSFMAFSDVRVYSDAAVWTSLTALLCFIGLIIWLIYLLRFNVFKRFGKQSSMAGLKTFLLLFSGMSFIVLPAFVPTLVESFRANRSYSTNEMITDINTINKNILQLNYSILPKQFKLDTIVKIKDVNDPGFNNEAPAVDEGVDNFYIDSVTIVKPQKNQDLKIYLLEEDYKIKLKEADSIKIISDSNFINYTAPNYAFLFQQDINSHGSIKMLTNIELYRAYVKSSPVIDVKKTNSELGTLLFKYKTYINNNNYYTDANDNYYESKLRNKYDLGSISNNLYNISEKKYRWDLENFGTYFRVFFYCAFILTLLLFIFRHSTTRTFFLTLLTGVVLFILSAVIVAFGSWEVYEILILMLVYFSVFAMLTFFINRNVKRELVQGISLNMITTFASFIPLIILGLIDSYHAYQHRFNIEPYYNNYNEYYKYAEIGGVILFLILLQPVIKKAYRKWYALPES